MVGSPASFAIESCITEAFERPSLRALGFFVLHVRGFRYGIYDPNATMLADSFDEVQRRIARRGSHTCPLAVIDDALKVADAANRALYDDLPDDSVLLGFSVSNLRRFIATNHILWVPDGDEAFDDGSHVLQFDVEDRVRLIAFQRRSGVSDALIGLNEIWMPADAHYEILQQWHRDFQIEWASSVKLP